MNGMCAWYEGPFIHFSLSPPLSFSSFLRNKSAIEQVTTGWASFYQQYHPLAEFVRQLETELANINPHIKDMLTITRTVERLKVCVCMCACILYVYIQCIREHVVQHAFILSSLPLPLPPPLPPPLPHFLPPYLFFSSSNPLPFPPCLSLSPPPLQFTQKELVARSGSLGVVKQYNVKLQEVLCRHITELPVVGDDIEATSKKWKTLTMLVEEK